MTMIRDAAGIKPFVTGTLGCRCPDHVFEQIEYDEGTTLPGFDASLRRLLVGKRLLIYILDTDDRAALRNILPRLVGQGKAERDRNGYNRLRIVVASCQPATTAPEAERLFCALPDLDDRIHLHVLCSTSVPALAPQ